MKTLGRIIIILVAFAVVMGITYVAVNAGESSSTNVTRFQSGERPALANGQFEGRPERHEEGGGGMMFGLIKNVGIIAIFVAIIVLPKNINKRRRLQTSMSDGL